LFDRQVVVRMGDFFGDVFLPAMERLVEADLSYEAGKRLLKIPATWGAKIGGEQSRERAAVSLGGRKPA
jgi:hypothetical protein